MEREGKERGKGDTAVLCAGLTCLRCCGVAVWARRATFVVLRPPLSTVGRAGGVGVAAQRFAASTQVASDISLAVQLQLGPACSLAAAAAAVVCRK